MRRALLPLAALLLAACGYGLTGQAVDVGHATATLTGLAHATEPGEVTWWFEYGPTTAYGSSTPAVTVEVDDPVAVEARVEGLEPGTEHHHRLCVVDAEGRGGCGADRTFTTGQPDRVVGNVLVQLPGAPFPVGVVLDVRSDADGTDVSGTAALFLPDSGSLRFGRVTCLRVVGDRATVGFDGPPYEDAVFTVEEAPPGGTPRLLITMLEEPTWTCPEPPTSPFGWQGTSGDLQVIDAP